VGAAGQGDRRVTANPHPRRRAATPVTGTPAGQAGLGISEST
jgi:hypothetical protein